MKKVVVFILCGIALLTMTACTFEKKADSGATATGIATSAGSKTVANEPADSDSTASDDGQINPDNTVKAAVAPDTAPKDADWSLDVNDTIDIDIEGIKISYTLTLQAVKHGGTTDLGSYTGTATFKQKADASGLSEEMVSVMGGVETALEAENVQIELVGYDREKYDDFGLSEDEPPLSNLTEADGMALGSFTISGTGKLNLSSIAPHTMDVRSASDNSTGEMPYKITVEGGQVSVSIPMLNLSDSFKGMITGKVR